MLVSLSVRNFKSIREAHVRFGPFTCFIGHNGVGKSNLFDAIHFLSALAGRDVAAAATEVRRTSDGGSSPLDLVFGRDPNRGIELGADMVVPPQTEDDFGQKAKPSTTLLTYRIRLRYRPQSDRLLVEHESRRTRSRSPLTVVGGTNTYDYPTILAAKREMASWRILHLEPSAMRTPDTRFAAPHVSASGGNMPATLHALAAKHPDTQAEILQDRAVLCIEEPENGIHPSRVPTLTDLLRDYAVDVNDSVGADNPLRQVVLNTHSPEVARQLSFDELVFVERAITRKDGPISTFRPISGAWRVNLPNGGESSAQPIDRQAVADFIGGSPVNPRLGQLPLEFGSAT